MFPRPVALLIASSAVTLVAASGAAAAPASGQHVTVISSCTAAKYQPTNYIFACGDGNRGMRHATYTWWTTKTAHGTATLFYNDCTPDCADGHFHHQKAEFTLFRVVSTSKYGPLFTRAEVDTRQGHDIYDLPTRRI